MLGNMPLQHTAYTVLGVLGLLVGISAIMSINANTLEPGVNKVERAIGQIGGYQSVTLGGQECGSAGVDCSGTQGEIRPKEQFEGALAYNMMISADCRLLVAVDGYMDEQPDRVEHFAGFDTLLNQTDFEPLCAGARAINLDPKEAIVDYVDQWDSENANDMEGRYGRVDFQAGEQFTLNENEGNRDDISDETLMSIRVENDIIKASSASYPDFWNGFRNAVYLPAGLESTGEWDAPADHELHADEVGIGLTGGENPEGEGTEGSQYTVGGNYLDATNQNDREIVRLYYYRPRFENVPILLRTYPEYRSHGQESGNGDQTDGRFEVFTEEARYRFCEGVQGYMQSNARNIDNGGEASGDRSYVEDAIFPKVQITSPEGDIFSCVPRRQNQIFYGYELEGDTCKIGEVDGADPESRELEEVEAEFICGYRQYTPEFEKFDWAEQPMVYRPAWYLQGCPDGPIEFPKSADADSTSGEVTFEGATTSLSGSSQGSSAIWNIEQLSIDSFDMSFTASELSLGPNYDGRIYINVNGEREAEVRIYSESESALDTGGSYQPRVSLEMDGESVYDLDGDMEEFSLDYSEDGNLELSTDGGSESVQIDTINSLGIGAEKNFGDDFSVEAEELKVTGVPEGCS
jgi:hypothetical protein